MKKNYIKKARKFSCLFLYMLFFINPVSSQNKSGLSIYSQALQGNLNTIDEHFSLISDPTVEEWYGYTFSKALLAMIQSSQESQNDFFNTADDAIATIKSQKSNTWSNYFLAEIYLYRSFINLKNKNEFQSLFDFRQAYRITENNLKNDKTFLPSHKTLGLIQVILGAVPDKYQWLVSFVGWEGSTENGLELISESTSNSIIKKESLLLLGLLNTYLLNDYPTSIQIYQTLTTEHPNDLIIPLVYAAALIKSSHSNEALYLLNKIKSNTSTFPQINYLLGEIYLQSGNYTKSRQAYLNFIQSSKGEDLVKDSYYKIGISYLIENNKEQAEINFNQSRNINSANTESDQYASRQLEKPLPDISLIQIRFAIDGGYYKYADSLLNRTNPKDLSQEDQIEYIYRKARLYHKSGVISKSISLYKEVINKSTSSKSYIGPNSALLLAYIYYEDHMNSEAEKYALIAINWKNHAYEEGIESSAKALLKKINN